jgi:hypothetical protein
MKLILILIFFTLIYEVKSQEIDSCIYYSNQFKSLESICKSTNVNSFRWLSINCITMGVSTNEEINELLGEDTLLKRKTITYEYHNRRNLDYDGTSGWFDYYWEYEIPVFCNTNDEIKLFPSTRGVIYFKNNIVVACDIYSIG